MARMSFASAEFNSMTQPSVACAVAGPYIVKTQVYVSV